MDTQIENLEILVSVTHQRLRVQKNGLTIAEFPVSTSKFGTGSQPGSFQTPLGKFKIAKKIGYNAPLFAVFRARQFTGEIASLGGSEDLILTRILWLEGIEPHNANTFDRFIYLHGTNQEHLLGTPASHGCIRMSNSDIVKLFDWVQEGTPVQILPTWPQNLENPPLET
ncbi:MAG: L,D-transpeptidase [Chthoniobacterales bacterium]|nr:L,D-transpeptidase [Chthoniobacterales bacterium]MCX7713836.1 L,D-transpeptidase [Chthoniobacterales bacterium]